MGIAKRSRSPMVLAAGTADWSGSDIELEESCEEQSLSSCDEAEDVQSACDALLVLPGQANLYSWLMPKDFVPQGVALAAEMAMASAQGAGLQEETLQQASHDQEELIVLPGQLDIRSWLAPKQPIFSSDSEVLAAEMEELARKTAELADEDAALGMGLALDLTDPEEVPKEVTMLAAAEELRRMGYALSRELAMLSAPKETQDTQMPLTFSSKSAALADEDAARSMGLSLDLTTPEEFPREVAMVVDMVAAAEEMRRVGAALDCDLAALAAPEAFAEDAWAAESWACNDAAAHSNDEAAAVASGLSLGLADQSSGCEEANDVRPSPLTPRRGASRLQKRDSSPKSVKRPWRPVGGGSQEDEKDIKGAAKHQRKECKTSAINPMKDSDAYLMPEQVTRWIASL